MQPHMLKKCETAYVLCNTTSAITTHVITVPDEGVGTDDTRIGADTERRKRRAD